MLGICLLLAATGTASPVFVPAPRFTLAWTHSIEKQRWEEDYTVLAPATPGAAPRLRAGEARIRGSAAGMEPPEGAVLHDGWYHYQPTPWPATPLRLTRSGYTADFDLCIEGHCERMADYLPSDGDITLLAPCEH